MHFGENYILIYWIDRDTTTLEEAQWAINELKKSYNGKVVGLWKEDQLEVRDIDDTINYLQRLKGAKCGKSN